MFEKWELSYQPFERDNKRWLLKLNISDEEIDELVFEIEATTGRPFITVGNDYNWGIYLYNLSEEEKKSLVNTLTKKCKNGKVVEELPKEIPGKEEKVVAPQKVVVKKKETKAETPLEKIPEDTGLNPRYTFEEFIIGPNNRFTHAAAMAVAENPGKVYNPLFIHGGVGLGKTHLMVAIGHYVKKKNPEMQVLYVTSERFINEVINALADGTLQQFRERYRKVDVLMVDDVQFLSESESTQEEFFHTFNELHQRGKQIILTSDRPPKKLTILEDRLRSRFEWGLIADIKSPSLETRVAILKKKGENENITLDENILLYVASKLKSNVRELEGFLKRINAYSTITGQPVTMELVKEIMNELLPEEERDTVVQVEVPTQSQYKPIQPPQYQPPQYQPQPPQYQPPQYQPQPPQYQPPQYQPQPPQYQPPQYQPQPPQYQPPQYQPQPPQYQPVGPTQIPKPASPPQVQKEFPTITPPVGQTPVTGSQKGAVSQDASLRIIEVCFFYPEGKDKELFEVKEKFKEVIKKHNLKFKLESVFDRGYDPYNKINYSMFTELCKTNKVYISIVIGPPRDAIITNDDFMNALSATMEAEKISMQFLPWAEINKDYRYLNLALDITLVKYSGPS